MKMIKGLRRGTYDMSDPHQGSFDPPRWHVSANYRPAQRGPADRVRDGWTLSDTIGGTARRYDTLAECQRWAEGRNQTEVEVLRRDDLTGWYLSRGNTLCVTVADPQATRMSHNGRPALELVGTDGTEKSIERTLRYFEITHLEAWT